MRGLFQLLLGVASIFAVAVGHSDTRSPSESSADTRVRQTPAEARIAAEIGGRIEYLHPDLKQGEFVPAGTVVLRIDAEDHAHSLRRAEAELKASRSMLDGLETQHALTRNTLEARQKSLEAADAEITKARMLRLQVEAIRKELNAIAKRRQLVKSQIARTESTVTNLKTMLTRAEISVPFDARIGKVNVKDDDFVTAGSTLFEVTSVETGVETGVEHGETARQPPREPAAVEPGGVGGMTLEEALDSLDGELTGPAATTPFNVITAAGPEVLPRLCERLHRPEMFDPQDAGARRTIQNLSFAFLAMKEYWPDTVPRTVDCLFRWTLQADRRHPSRFMLQSTVAVTFGDEALPPLVAAWDRASHVKEGFGRVQKIGNDWFRFFCNRDGREASTIDKLAVLAEELESTQRLNLYSHISALAKCSPHAVTVVGNAHAAELDPDAKRTLSKIKNQAQKFAARSR